MNLNLKIVSKALNKYLKEVETFREHTLVASINLLSEERRSAVLHELFEEVLEIRRMIKEVDATIDHE